MQFVFLLRKITHKLYRYRGLSRVADLVRRSYMHSGLLFTIPDFDGTLLFNCNLDEHIGSQVFWRGAYSGDQLALLREMLKPGMVFLDIGANNGEFSLFAAKYLSAGLVIAFEPAVSPAKELEANVAANDLHNVRIVGKALGRSPGQRMLFNAEDKFEGETNEGLYTFYPRKGVEHPGNMADVIRLDDFIRSAQPITRIDIMKIDIEGAELDMLRGARETIAEFRPVIFLEINAVTSRAAGYDPVAILQWLGEMNYRFETIGRHGRTRPLQPDQIKTFQNICCLPCER